MLLHFNSLELQFYRRGSKESIMTGHFAVLLQLTYDQCPVRSSGSRSFGFPSTHAFTGGQIKSLHKGITYTRKIQPST